MEIADAVFKRKRYAPERLLSYGFKECGGEFTKDFPVMQGQFTLTVRIAAGGAATSVTDNASGEPYALYRVEGAVGAFVGEMRGEVYSLLSDVAEKCFFEEIFRCAQTKRVLEYALQRYGTKEEYLWEKFPDNAVLRRSDNAKWYAAILTVGRKKLGLDGEGDAEVIDLRADPAKIDSLADGKSFFPGYHMNKKHWYSVLLDGSVPDGELFARIDESFALAKKS